MKQVKEGSDRWTPGRIHFTGRGGGVGGVIIRHDVHIASHPLPWSTESDEHVALPRPTLASLTSLPLFSLLSLRRPFHVFTDCGRRLLASLCFPINATDSIPSGMACMRWPIQCHRVKLELNGMETPFTLYQFTLVMYLSDR